MNYLRPTTFKNIDEVFNAVRLKILQFTLYTVLSLALIGTVFAIPWIVQNNEWSVLPPVLLSAAFIIGLAFLHRISFNIRSFGLLLIIYLLGLAGLLRPDLTFDGRVALLTFIVLANILRGTGYGILASIFASVTVLFFGWVTGPLAINDVATHFTSGQLEWLGTGIAFSSCAMIFTVSLSYLQNTMLTFLKEQYQDNYRLTNQNKSLDNQAQEQYRIINQNATQLSIYRSISSQIKNSKEIEQVLGKILEIVTSNLNFTFAGIYFIDDRNEFAVLKEGSGDVGRTLVESNFRIRLSENGSVTRAVQFKEASVVTDTSQVETFVPTPLMAATKAEAAVPIIKQDRVIGVLDIQSDVVHEFTPEELRDLEWLAGQISVCMEIITLEKQMEGLKKK